MECPDCKIDDCIICSKCSEFVANDSRLTCKWTPPEQPDPRFDYDALIETSVDDIQDNAETDLFEKFSVEDQYEIREYANIHSITITEAINYQTHCHNCGKETTRSLINSDSHQYCSSRCQEYCETYCYSCVYEDKCLVCANWKEDSDN